MSQTFFQAEDGIRDVERSRGLGDVYKRQIVYTLILKFDKISLQSNIFILVVTINVRRLKPTT